MDLRLAKHWVSSLEWSSSQRWEAEQNQESRKYDHRHQTHSRHWRWCEWWNSCQCWWLSPMARCPRGKDNAIQQFDSILTSNSEESWCSCQKSIVQIPWERMQCPFNTSWNSQIRFQTSSWSLQRWEKIIKCYQSYFNSHPCRCYSIYLEKDLCCAWYIHCGWMA